jgi:hypothetical protein
VDILGELPPHDLIQIDDPDGDFGPAQRLRCLDPTPPDDQGAVGADDGGMQETEVGDVGGQGVDVTKVVAEPVAPILMSVIGIVD